MQLQDKTSTKIDDEPKKLVQNMQSPMKTNESIIPVIKAYTQPLDTVTDLQTSHSDADHTPHVSHQTEGIKVKDVTSEIPCTCIRTYSITQRQHCTHTHFTRK